jgi:hypothetical protein
VRTFVSAALTLGAFIALGYFVAEIGAETLIQAFDEPGTPGKIPIQFSLGFAVVVGWALLSAVEAVWKEDDDPPDEWWATFAFAAFPLLMIASSCSSRST